MNTNEFQSLNNNFMEALNKRLQSEKSSAKVLQQNPFNGQLVVAQDQNVAMQQVIIGIVKDAEPNFYELYVLYNDGNVVKWDFKGHAQI